MGKKEKTKTFKLFRRRPIADISFDNSHVKFGNRTFIIDGLFPQFKNLFIFLYKYRKLPPYFYKEEREQKVQQKVSLTQIEAYSLILNGFKNQSVFETELRKIDKFIDNLKNSGQFIHQVRSQDMRNLKLREGVCKLIKIALQKRGQIQADLAECQIQSREVQNQQMVMKYFRTVIIRKEHQLFSKTIVMIIEYEQSSTQKSYLPQTKCIVIFEQCYPEKIYEKNRLIQIIGLKVYENKIANFLQYSKKYFRKQLHKNSNFIVCHQCMEPISTKDKNQVLECLNIIQTSQTLPQSYTDPNLFYQRIIKSNFQAQKQSHLELAYNCYYRTMAQNIVQFKCNRYLCLECSFTQNKNQTGTDTFICHYCIKDCQCQKCKDYRLIVRFLGHYRNFGGNLNQISKQFAFKYSQFQKREKYIRYGPQQNFRFADKMKMFYDRLTKIQNQISNKNLQKERNLKKRENLPLKKTYDQISFYKLQNFQKKQKNTLKKKSESSQQDEKPISCLLHSDTKRFNEKALFLIPQRQKKRQMMQKKKKKQLQNEQKGEFIYKILTNQQLKQAIQKDLSSLRQKLQKQKHFLKQVPAQVSHKQSKSIAIRPRTQAEKQQDNFREKKDKMRLLPIRLRLNMPIQAQSNKSFVQSSTLVQNSGEKHNFNQNNSDLNYNFIIQQLLNQDQQISSLDYSQDFQHHSQQQKNKQIAKIEEVKVQMKRSSTEDQVIVITSQSE